MTVNQNIGNHTEMNIMHVQIEYFGLFVLFEDIIFFLRHSRIIPYEQNHNKCYIYLLFIQK